MTTEGHPRHGPTFTRGSEVVRGLRVVDRLDGDFWDLSVGDGCDGCDVRERVNASGTPLSRIFGGVKTSYNCR